MTDIGQRCVHCGEDTSFGSGRFVNRIPADAEYEATNKNGKIIFAENEYRVGYACYECGGYSCCRCDKQIYLDEDVRADQVYGEEFDEFPDQSVFLHYECLTAKEKRLYDLREI